MLKVVVKSKDLRAAIRQQPREILVSNLGVDHEHCFNREADGWKAAAEIAYFPGEGLRHLAIHDGILYIGLELIAQVTKHPLSSLPKEPILLSPPSGGAAAAGTLVAEIVISKPTSLYIPYVYIFDRNDPSPEGDTIAIFEASTSDELELIGEVGTGLNHLRRIVFGGPEDQWVATGGSKGGGVLRACERSDSGRNLKLGFLIPLLHTQAL
ncbi:hypothetical protein PQX77_002439 [Marasmius sp. AFHP31]|nr:hypothetical protein PQX77_002439 [Marasmius sp. AFHP31]